MAVDLSVEFLGVKFSNPFILSPTPASRSSGLEKAAKLGWGGAVTWTGGEIINGYSEEVAGSIPHDIKFIDRPPAYWTFQIASHAADRSGMENESERHQRILERVGPVVAKAKQAGIPIIVNISGGLNPELWVKSCMAAQNAAADIIEVNFSYALHPKFGMHLGFGKDMDLSRRVVKTIRQEIRVPIMVKLNALVIPEVLKEWARVCVEAGADAISITNSIPGISGVNIETGLPRTAFIDTEGRLRGSAYQMCEGPTIRPLGLAAVALVDSAVDVPIVAIGGVSDWYSAVEYMMLGAHMVQVGSAAMVYGHRMVRDLIRGLEQFMERKGYRNVYEFVGLTNKRYLVGERYCFSAPGKAQPRKIVVDGSKCDGCGRCEAPCETSAHEAIKVIDGVARVNHELCIRCNLCQLVCPQGAITVAWDEAIWEAILHGG